MALVQGAVVEVKAQEEQRAWNEDVRAFAIALLSSPRGPSVDVSGDTRILITGAVNMANEVEIHRQARRNAKK